MRLLRRIQESADLTDIDSRLPSLQFGRKNGLAGIQTQKDLILQTAKRRQIACLKQRQPLHSFAFEIQQGLAAPQKHPTCIGSCAQRGQSGRITANIGRPVQPTAAAKSHLFCNPHICLIGFALDRMQTPPTQRNLT